MAVHDEFDQPIPVTVPVALEGGPQLAHFGLGQVLPDPVGIVPPPSLRATGRITNNLARRSCTTLPDTSGLVMID